MSNGTSQDPHWDITQQHAAELHSLGNEVSEIRSDVSGIKSSLSSLTSQTTAGFSEMRHQYQAAAKPRPTPPFEGWMGLGVSTIIGLGMIISFFFNQTTSNMQREMDMRFVSVAAALEEQREHVALDDAREVRNSYAKGYAEAKAEDLAIKVTHLDELNHVRDTIITELQEKAAAAEVSRRATGEYAKENRAMAENE